MTEIRQDLTRTTLAVLFISALIAASLWILQPFLPAVIWATMIVVATWPMMRAIEARLGGKRGLAVAVMTLAMLVVIVAPVAIAIVTVAEHTGALVELAKSVADFSVPPPPDWIRGLPLAGERIAAEWEKFVGARPEELAASITPHIKGIAAWIAGQAGNFGLLSVHLLLTVVIAAILYATGETAAAGVLAFARRLARDRGEHVAILSAQAIRAVALGVVVTALVQSTFGGIGLAISGVPYPTLLTAVMFLLGVAQIGAAPVLIGAIIWLYYKDNTLWGTVLLVWSVPALALDNFLRPILIKRGADLPLLLIFAGVIGGLLAFGVIGLFVGPVVLAVTYTLLVSWVEEGGTPAPEAEGDEGIGGKAD